MKNPQPARENSPGKTALNRSPSNSPPLRIAIAQLNPVVGDIPGNAEKVIENVHKARDVLGADVVIFPELTLTGYPPEDLLLRPDLYPRIDGALARIAGNTQGIDAVLGYPHRSRKDSAKIHNACAYLRDGAVLARYYKQELPNYGVFDEKRYFAPGHESVVVPVKGIPVTLTICEDIWSPGPMRGGADLGAKLMFNINASPYHTGKIHQRRSLLAQRAREGAMPIVYVNLVGGQDELVFDGHSLAVDAHGEVTFQAPDFETGLFMVEFDTLPPQVKGTPLDGRQQPIDKPTENNPGNLGRAAPTAVRARPATICPLPDREESIYRALVTGVRDYVEKNRFSGAIVGLSGGIDSALTLAIGADALGADHVEAVLMPSRYSADMSIEDAVTQAENLGVPHHVIPIEPVFSAFLHSLADVFAGAPVDVTEENIQARCRGVLLMAISNKTGKMVLTTGNKSEMAVGYATLYGDMAGGFAPLKDVSKEQVYRLARWRNDRGRNNRNKAGHGEKMEDGFSGVIPQRVLTRAPSAELAPDQKDEDSLPPYSILDAILERYVERDQSPEEIIGEGFDPETVARVIAMVLRNEYKRRQAAPGVRITPRAFGRERRYPITCGYV
ncbi:MAG: NAD+ synthase (glutamine-hydrolysing) [Candidatus Kentron sp. G]|nr:MAG: NAD+ synthase (glutamine-hydrolysing) [Candidatus Kentron sp. G]VFM95533.1 MAG: NAD+ synthase (glutamine-hydrolysing) [Candidatus Kentron sp. G]VFM97097.1 MAG: NAD+ synthase (glutamine-hydrolysing) [Candidatus Kentron sp. G]